MRWTSNFVKVCTGVKDGRAVPLVIQLSTRPRHEDPKMSLIAQIFLPTSGERCVVHPVL
jgi:hypothetical protein